MSNYNRVVLMGRLTRDVELRHTQGGTAVAGFGMAINRKWSQNGEPKESVCYVDLKAWSKTAELLAQYLKKGDPIHVEGRLEFESWEKDGEKRSKLFVTIDSFQFIGGKRDEADAPAAKSARKTAPARDEGSAYDDIPF